MDDADVLTRFSFQSCQIKIHSFNVSQTNKLIKIDRELI